MRIEDSGVYENIAFGVAFSYMGIMFIFKRKKIANAFVESGDVFWGKFGFPSSGRKKMLLANIMVPAIGVVFLAAGIMMIFKAIMFLIN